MHYIHEVLGVNYICVVHIKPHTNVGPKVHHTYVGLGVHYTNVVLGVHYTHYMVGVDYTHRVLQCCEAGRLRTDMHWRHRRNPCRQSYLCPVLHHSCHSPHHLHHLHHHHHLLHHHPPPHQLATKNEKHVSTGQRLIDSIC